MQLRLIHGRYLEDVEGRGVEEEEGDEGEPPHRVVHPRYPAHVPEGRASVPVVNEVHDAGDGQGQGHQCKEHAVRPLSHHLLCVGAEAGQAAVRHTEAEEDEQHGDLGAVGEALEPVHVLCAHPCRWVYPHNEDEAEHARQQPEEEGPRLLGLRIRVENGGILAPELVERGEVLVGRRNVISLSPDGRGTARPALLHPAQGSSLLGGGHTRHVLEDSQGRASRGARRGDAPRGASIAAQGHGGSPGDGKGRADHQRGVSFSLTRRNPMRQWRPGAKETGRSKTLTSPGGRG
mmetsp:Transcript_11838/g.37605  ORF Transcript_11838/g.37605 Transcript_11838/m.37605 type:complete len:291 (+) Transcript_11838:636-1508(+)